MPAHLTKTNSRLRRPLALGQSQMAMSSTYLPICVARSASPRKCSHHEGNLVLYSLMTCYHDHGHNIPSSTCDHLRFYCRSNLLPTPSMQSIEDRTSYQSEADTTHNIRWPPCLLLESSQVAYAVLNHYRPPHRLPQQFWALSTEPR